MSYLLLFFATFIHVGLKATQQLNVTNFRYAWIAPVSFGLAAVEVYVIASISRSGFASGVVATMGLGGALGCIASMRAFEKWRGR